jgi:hypothetical protein
MAKPLNYKQKISIATATVLGIIIVCLLLHWWDSYAVLGTIAGVAVGWALGIILAPYDDEKKKFQGSSKALTGFIGGIGLVKLEQLLDKMPDDSKKAMLELIVLRRFIIGGVVCLVTAIIVFVYGNGSVTNWILPNEPTEFVENKGKQGETVKTQKRTPPENENRGRSRILRGTGCVLSSLAIPPWADFGRILGGFSIAPRGILGGTYGGAWRG